MVGDLFVKIIVWLILVAVLVSVVTSFRTEILSSGAAYDMMVAALEAFPFAAWCAQIVANIGQFGITLQGLAPVNIILDMAKLFTMCLVCPLVIGFCTLILLPVPNYADWYDRERYMNGLSYRIKEALLSVMAMPICAWVTVQLIQWVQLWVTRRFPLLHPILVNLFLMVLAFALSTLTLWMRGGSSFGGILSHRLITDLLGNLLKIIGTNLLCFAIVLTILNDQWQVVLYLMVLLFIYLLAVGLLVQCVKGNFD